MNNSKRGRGGGNEGGIPQLSTENVYMKDMVHYKHLAIYNIPQT